MLKLLMGFAIEAGLVCVVWRRSISSSRAKFAVA